MGLAFPQMSNDIGLLVVKHVVLSFVVVIYSENATHLAQVCAVRVLCPVVPCLACQNGLQTDCEMRVVTIETADNFCSEMTINCWSENLLPLTIGPHYGVVWSAPTKYSLYYWQHIASSRIYIHAGGLRCVGEIHSNLKFLETGNPRANLQKRHVTTKVFQPSKYIDNTS